MIINGMKHSAYEIKFLDNFHGNVLTKYSRSTIENNGIKHTSYGYQGSQESVDHIRNIKLPVLDNIAERDENTKSNKVMIV